MTTTRTSALHLALCAFLLVAGTLLWINHARDWDLGRSASILSYDSAQYALAAREVAEHGRWATPFALPLEIAREPSPPWPLALVQPGLVGFEAALFRLVPGDGTPEGEARREWLVLMLPVACYLGIGVLFGLAASLLLGRFAPDLSPLARAGAGVVVGLAFLLDPESQHSATGGFTELPFTLGLAGAIAAIALGFAARRPVVFGLLLGATGWFRGNMLWLAPVLALAAAGSAERKDRVRVALLSIAGYALPLAPWWIYKWRAFGSPAWDLSWVSIWDGVRGHTWFTLNHLPWLPVLPTGAEAVSEIARKIGRNLLSLLLALTAGPRGAWIAALAIWTFVARSVGPDQSGNATTRPLRAAGAAVLGVLGVSLIAAAASVPLDRYLFPARVVASCAGVLALWALIARAPMTLLSERGRSVARIGLAVLVVGWGVFLTARNSASLRAAAQDRGVPSTADMMDLVRRIDREVPAGEPVMSNLGPILAWYGRRPVVHLALGPPDVDACRRLVELRNVVLVFRDPGRAWPQWVELLQRPERAARDPELNIARARAFRSRDGFLVVWLELGAPRARIAWRGALAARFPKITTSSFRPRCRLSRKS